MKIGTKLNVLLALTDALRAKFKHMVTDHTVFYNKSQGAFLGEKNTYTAKEGTADEPSKRSFVKVITTVDEKVDYFIKESGQFIEALFSQEKTNAMGLAKAELVVGGDSWGEFTSLELLRLKSLLESKDMGDMEAMLSVIPVRSDSEVWAETAFDEYADRKVWETPMVAGISRTTDKNEYILEDPNLVGKTLPAGYQPKTAFKTVVREIGDYTIQKFSGQWSHRQRAAAMKRRSDLIIAVTQALKECNECEVVKSTLTADKIFGFILKG